MHSEQRLIESKSRFFLFVLLELFFFLFLSRHSFFWLDESFTVATGFSKPLSDYLVGMTAEGNTAPLFYVVERVLVKIVQYSSSGGWAFLDSFTLIRLCSILPTSLICAAFLEKAWQHNRKFKYLLFPLVLVGLNSSTAILDYSWQARHYGLWMMASGFFSFALWGLIFDNADPEISSRKVIFFLISSYLLFFTVGFSIEEVPLGFVLLLLLRRDLKLLKVGLLLLPGLLYVYFYASRHPAYSFIWPGARVLVLQLIAAHMRSWLLLLSAILIFVLKDKKRVQSALLYFGYICGMCAAITVIFYLNRGATGFEVANRYFILCMPHLLASFLILSENFSGKLPRILPWIMSFFILTSLIKLYPRIKEIYALPLFDETVEAQMLPVEEKGRCLCLAPETNWPNINSYGMFYPKLLWWNTHQASSGDGSSVHCSNPSAVFIRLKEPQKMARLMTVKNNPEILRELEGSGTPITYRSVNLAQECEN